MIRNIRVDTLKARNKNYKQTNKVSIAQIKQNSKNQSPRAISTTNTYVTHTLPSHHLQKNDSGAKLKPPFGNS